MSIGDTGCMLTTSLPVYHSFFGVGKMMNSRWWNCEGRKFLPKDIVHPSNELVKRLQRGEVCMLVMYTFFLNVQGIDFISGLYIVYQLRIYACMYASGNI